MRSHSRRWGPGDPRDLMRGAGSSSVVPGRHPHPGTAMGSRARRREPTLADGGLVSPMGARGSTGPHARYRVVIGGTGTSSALPSSDGVPRSPMGQFRGRLRAVSRGRRQATGGRCTGRPGVSRARMTPTDPPHGRRPPTLSPASLGGPGLSGQPPGVRDINRFDSQHGRSNTPGHRTSSDARGANPRPHARRARPVRRGGPFGVRAVLRRPSVACHAAAVGGACAAHGQETHGATCGFAYRSRPRAGSVRGDLRIRVRNPPTGRRCTRKPRRWRADPA